MNKIHLAVASLFAATSIAATAAPVQMTDAEMAKIVAGASSTYVTVTTSTTTWSATEFAGNSNNEFLNTYEQTRTTTTTKTCPGNNINSCHALPVVTTTVVVTTSDPVLLSSVKLTDPTQGGNGGNGKK